MVHIREARGLCNTERQNSFVVMKQKISLFKYLELMYGLSLEYHFEVDRKTKFELHV